MHSGSLWTLYELPLGLEIGGGVRYVGTRYTNVANTRQDRRLLARRRDGRLRHQRADARCGVNVFNIFDERYIEQVGGGHFVPGAGRSAVATLAFGL